MRVLDAWRGIPRKNINRILIGAGLVLLIPLVAMQFTDEVDWDLTDFVTVGVLLLGAGLLYDLVMVNVSTKYRVVIAGVIVAAALLIWLELAVGIFGTPLAGS